jgi:mono/diheme cytochrome c family protein
MRLALAVCLSIGALVQAARLPADSGRGKQLFATLGCAQCHTAGGSGGSTAPDLSKLADRNFTPSRLAATMWNHAPGMQASMRVRGIGGGGLDGQGSADLFAYFYSTRLFERAADAGRGKRLFTEKRCADCHGLTRSPNPEAKSIAEWDALGNPIALVDAMWNHAASMRQEFAKRKIEWPELSSQDLADMLIYLRNAPGSRAAAEGRLEITSSDTGERLFASKGCAGCHSLTARVPLTARLKGATLTDIAVAMWNHSSKMAADPARLSVEQMRDLTSYLWADQFFEDSGRAPAGRRVFGSKGCANCHEASKDGAPKLVGTGREFSGATMTAAVFNHGGAMVDQMRSKGIPWPRFESTEMADLIAYLNSGKKP